MNLITLGIMKLKLKKNQNGYNLNAMTVLHLNFSLLTLN